MPRLPTPFLVLEYEIDGPLAIKYAASFLPFLIAILLHYPGTRTLRLTLWPFTVAAGAWVIATCRGSLPVDALRAANYMLVLNLYGATKYAFARHPPVVHPLPRQPPLGFLRRFKPVRGILLLLNSFRSVGIAPNPPLKALPGNYQWLRSVGKHYLALMYYTIAIDFASWPLLYLAPTTFGRPLIGGDFEAWYTNQAHQLGLPPVFVYVWWALVHAFTVYLGMQAAYHMYAFAGIGSGVYLPEEFPPAMDKPWLSTSLFELWGRRYHTFMKPLFIYFSPPAKYVGATIHVLGCFFVSAVFHVLIYYPGHHELDLWPFAVFYLGNATGAVLERAFYKITGRRVGGPLGRLWVYAVVLVSAYPMNMHMYGIGQVGDIRGELSTALRPYSLAEWTAYALGLGTRPTEPIPDFLSGLGAYSSPEKVAQRLAPPK